MRKKHLVSRDGKLSKDDITKLMELHPSEIVFTKKDGTRRLMKCSLNYNLMPKKKEGKESKPKSNVSDSNIMVISLDGAHPQWRSIKLESIISVVVE